MLNHGRVSLSVVRVRWMPMLVTFVVLTFSPIKEFTRNVFDATAAIGLPHYVLVQGALLIALLTLGIVSKRSARWTAPEWVALCSALSLFLLATALAFIRHELQTESFLVVGTILIVALTRLPGTFNVPAVLQAASGFIFVLVSVYLFLNWNFVMGNSSGLLDIFGAFTQANGGNRGRIAAFYLYPMSLGLIGGMFLIVATLSGGWRKWILAVAGVALVIAPLSRTASVAVVVALVPLLWYSTAASRMRWIRPLIAALGLLALLLVTYVTAMTDPDLSERGGVWLPVVKALPGTWLFGMGVDGMNSLNLSIGQSPDVQAHNMFLDAIARNGILALALLVTTVVAAFVASLQAARRGYPQAMALVVLVSVIGLAEPALDFRTWNESWALLLASLLIAQWARSQPKRLAEVPSKASVAPLIG